MGYGWSRSVGVIDGIMVCCCITFFFIFILPADVSLTCSEEFDEITCFLERISILVYLFIYFFSRHIGRLRVASFVESICRSRVPVL